MLYIDYKKSSFEVKKVSEIKNVIAITNYDEYNNTVKNSLGEVIFQFGPRYMRSKVPFDHETYWDAVKTEIQHILIQYNCI